MKKQPCSKLTKVPSDRDSNPTLAANPGDQCNTTLKNHSAPRWPKPYEYLKRGNMQDALVTNGVGLAPGVGAPLQYLGLRVAGDGAVQG